MSESDALFAENIRRIRCLAGELGLDLGPALTGPGTWTAGLRFNDIDMVLELEAGESRLRLVVRFQFDSGFADWLMPQLDDLQQVCYHYGCCHLVAIESGRIVVSLALTLYFSGLQYYALKEAIDDLAQAGQKIRHLLQPGVEPVEGGNNGHP